MRTYRRSLFYGLTRALTIAASIGVACHAQADRVDDYIRHEMAKFHIPGLSMAVMRNGNIVKAKGYGLANVETGSVATENTVYKIGSVSKQFISAGIMLLVQDGKLKVDDPVSNFLDGAPESWRAMTVRHLLTHTAGLPEDPPGFEPYTDQAIIDPIHAAYSQPLAFQPGEKISYSNLGYYVLAEVIRKVSGMSWQDFIQTRIFTPLGMSSTRATTASEIVIRRANGYTQKDGRQINAENWIAVRPSGAFLSTVTDMARWDKALYSDDILTGISRNQTWTPVTLKDGTSVPYGFGWSVAPFRGHRRVLHNGNLPGFNSEFERFIDDKISVVVLVNTDRADPSIIARGIAGMFIDGIAFKPIPDPQPRVTAHIKDLIMGLVAGRVDSTAVTAKLGAYLTGDPLKNWTKVLSEPGRVRSIRLVDRVPQGSVYRITYPGDSLIFNCALDPSGVVSDFGVLQE